MRQILTIMIIAVLPGSILAQQVPKTDLFVAFFVKGVVSVNDPTTENLQTNFTITNPGKSPTQVNIQFFSSAGNLLSMPLQAGPGRFGEPQTILTNPFEIPAESSVTVSIPPDGFLQAGWVRLASTQPITAQEGLNWLFMLHSQALLPIASTLASTAIQPSEPTQRFAIALSDEPSFTSGVAIVAPNNAVSGTLILTDSRTSRPVASRQITINARSQFLDFGAQLFPEITSITNGTIVGDFAGEVLVTSIRMHSATRRLVPNLVTQLR